MHVNTRSTSPAEIVKVKTVGEVDKLSFPTILSHGTRYSKAWALGLGSRPEHHG